MTKDSRLEIFLKALCSLDYSDLPTPLSRVEVLWNCLVTGETAPDFQPQSKTEKYLMTILGVYDLEDIPKPISRAETLLYKLATGDTNVELEDGSKSRYERLLSEIVANGGAGDNVDFEYVTHVLSWSYNALYNTAEKPVKSAILKGNTKYRDIDTGDILDTFDETKNLELVSVKMPVLTTTGGKNFSSVNSGSIKKHTGVQENHKITDIKLAPNEEYTLSFNSDISTLRFFLYDEIGTEIFQKWEPGSITFQTNECENYYLVIYTFYDGDYTFSELQIEQGSVATPYEPYKSNILTVDEEVGLRGIGDVQDTLDCLTGELTERIGEVMLDGSGDEKWLSGSDVSWNDSGDTIGFFINDFNLARGEILLSDKLLPNVNIFKDDIECFYISTEWSWLGVRIYKTKLSSLTVNGFKQYLQQNPIIVQYQLKTESVKTVDLTTIDQDGKETELKTFNDITHVSLSSEGLIPEAEITVATKNPDDISQASTMSLRMNDISEKQNELQNEVDTQSESIDSTMMATTEIYEQTL